jgi:hypothetical protein
MKRLILSVAVLALLLPATALAKGPSAATVDGPGTGGGLPFTGGEGDGSALALLSESAGFFPAVFEQTPNPMLAARPTADLGPKYTITYTVPGPDNDTFMIVQDLYPYAASGPVTYTKPGQPIFDMTTHGGWYQASADLKDTLVSGGLPASRPNAPADGGRWSLPTMAAVILAAAAALAVVAFFMRRRLRPGARMAGSPS